MVEVVNVVASGSLGLEFDLEAITAELGDLAEYDPGKYPGSYIRLGESSPLITLYRTGKYIITGAASKQEASSTRDTFLNLLNEHDILPEATDEWFTFQNYVCMGDLERDINLSALAIGLGLENTEYEPEQFPGLVYRSSDSECVLLVFASGKAVVTGASSVESANKAFSKFKKMYCKFSLT